MIKKLKEKLKKHPNIYNFLYMIIIYGGRQIKFAWGRFLRCIGVYNKYDYAKLKEFKDIHKGKRCFIVGTGPSLTMSDLSLIEAEYSFSVNSIVLSFAETNWRPTYYAIQDRFAYEKLKDDIRDADIPYLFAGISDRRMTPVISCDYIPFPLNLLDHGKAIPNHITKFSDDAFRVVYAGHSIVYSAMELAVYMGFEEIILLGVDCDYSKEVNHVKAYSVQDDVHAAYLMRESYKVAREFADKNGLTILNATRGAKLDVFERRRLEDILDDNY